MVASNLNVMLLVVSLSTVVLAIIFLSVYWLNRVVDRQDR
jgi:hypothetical protein